MKTAVTIEPISMGKALALTNFIMAFLFAVAASLTGVEMTGLTWKILMTAPFLAGVAGMVYGMIGGTIYNAMAKKKEAALVISPAA